MTFEHFVQNLSDQDVATLIVESLGGTHIDVEFDDDIADLGERSQSAVVHLKVGEESFFSVLVLDDRGLVLQVHPNLAMIASRIGGTEEICDDWVAGLCQAAPAKPDEFVVLQRITDRFILAHM